MPEYVIVIKRSAEKEISNLPLSVVERLYQEFISLSHNPYPNGVKKLAGFKNLYRIRINDYRVIYSIENKELVIHILKVGHRKDIYRL